MVDKLSEEQLMSSFLLEHQDALEGYMEVAAWAMSVEPRLSPLHDNPIEVIPSELLDIFDSDEYFREVGEPDYTPIDWNVATAAYVGVAILLWLHRAPGDMTPSTASLVAFRTPAILSPLIERAGEVVGTEQWGDTQVENVGYLARAVGLIQNGVASVQA